MSFSVALLLAGCAQKTVAPEKYAEGPTFFERSHFLTVVNGYVWITKEDLIAGSAAQAEMERVRAKDASGEWVFTQHLPEIVGQNRAFSFIPLDAKKNATNTLIVIQDATYYHFGLGEKEKSRALREAKFKDCNGYPEAAIQMPIMDETETSVRSGYLFEKDSKLVLSGAKDVAPAFKLYRKVHAAYVEKTYPKMFRRYTHIIDRHTEVVRTPNGDLFFLAPNPAVDETKNRAYLIRKDSKEVVAIPLPVPVSCAT